MLHFGGPAADGLYLNRCVFGKIFYSKGRSSRQYLPKHRTVEIVHHSKGRHVRQQDGRFDHIGHQKARPLDHGNEILQDLSYFSPKVILDHLPG